MKMAALIIRDDKVNKMTPHNIFCQLLKRVGVLILVCLSAVAVAQEGETARFNFDIDRQNIGAAVRAIAMDAGVQIMMPSEYADAYESPPVRGEYSVEQALRLVLDDSDFEYLFISEDSIAIKKRGESEAGGDEEVEVGDAAEDTVLILENLLVTGTRLKGINPAAPLTVISREDIDRGGYTNMEEVMRRLPQNLSSITSVSADLRQGEFGDGVQDFIRSPVGASSINLRGLGSRATLILINGHRTGSSAQAAGAFTDISSIPLSMVERIEVLTDGASAIYGADAVAGVVNVILRKDYDGLVTQARYESSSAGADLWRVNLANTFSWGSGFLTAAVDFSESDSADTNKFIHGGPQGPADFTDLGGVNMRVQGFGLPGAVYEAIVPDAPWWWPIYYPGVPWNPPLWERMIGDQIDGDASQSVYERLRIGPSIKSSSVRANLQQEFGQSLIFTMDAAYTKQENTQSWAPGLGDFQSLMSSSRPGRYTTIPVNNPNNPYGEEVLVAYSYANEFAQMEFSSNQEQENYRFATGLSGDLPFGEKTSFTLDFISANEKGTNTNLWDITGIWSGDPMTRVLPVLEQLNVFTDGSDASVVAANVDLLNTWVQQAHGEFESDLLSFEGTVNTPLFELSGGDAQLVAGFQLRQEDVERIELGFNDTDIPNIAGSDRDITALFAELGFPLTKSLTMTLAARYENISQKGTGQMLDYGYAFSDLQRFDLPGIDFEALTGVNRDNPVLGFGELGPQNTVKGDFSHTSPSVTLSWQPNHDWRLRGTWGESFLAPYATQQFGLVQLNDFTGAWMYQYGFEMPPGVTRVVQLTGPNAFIEPQIATSWTVGFDYTPASISGLDLRVTYAYLDFENYISTADQFGQFGLLVENYEMLPEIFQVLDDGSMLFDARNLNFAGRTSETIDISTRYSFDTAYGGWQVGLMSLPRTLSEL